MTTESATTQTILAIDDTPANLALINGLLKDSYKVRVANSGERGLALATTETPPDLILLDIMMPGLDGWEVCQRLKSDPTTQHVPIIFLTSRVDADDERKGLDLGAVDYITKPINPPVLLARVKTHLTVKASADLLRDWNLKLEQRVQDQISQLDRLGRLKGFFSPQLAESIINHGGEDLLKTHRREVVVAFLDLRGFTHFTDTSEPEEVMGVLGEYHHVMGQLITAHEGTLERFAGDGLMIFFNDPIKLENPMANAVKMALEMQAKFVLLRAAWKKRGYDLDLGIGIAQGYATLGAIGFEGRWDYACIGSVTNLAARLCNDAKGGQILTNQKTLARIEDAVEAESLGELTLKGVVHPVPVFNITAFKA